MSTAFDLIRPARWPDDKPAVSALFEAYAASLDIDLGYQDFASELVALPGKYAGPDGALLVAEDPQRGLLGCVALRAMEPEGCCEMKRLYALPQARGLGLGKALVQSIIVEAARLGYGEIRLDSLPSMGDAIRLYRHFGFELMSPYYQTPVAGTVFLKRSLED